MSKKKNKSKMISDGTIIQTRDEYFEEQEKYRKPGYQNKGNYRKAVVIGSNVMDELMVVKLYSKSGVQLSGVVSRYKPFVETKDEKKNPIKIGAKFIPSKKKLSNNNLRVIVKDCFNKIPQRKNNRLKARKLKGRE